MRTFLIEILSGRHTIRESAYSDGGATLHRWRMFAKPQRSFPGQDLYESWLYTDARIQERAQNIFPL